MGLPGEGAKGHATGAEALQDALHRLHLVEGDGGAIAGQVQQVPQGGEGALLQLGSIKLVVIVLPAGHRFVQQLGHGRVVHVVLPAGARLDEAHVVQPVGSQLRKGPLVEGHGFLGQVRQAQPPQPGGGAPKGQLQQLGANADRLKDLGPLVTAQ